MYGDDSSTALLAFLGNSSALHNNRWLLFSSR